MNFLAKTIATLALLSVAVPVMAGITMTDPELYSVTAYRLEAQMRGGSFTVPEWKLAFFYDHVLHSSTGDDPGLVQDEVVYPFRFTYTAATGVATVEFAGQALVDVLPMNENMDIAKFKFFLRSQLDVGTATLSDVLVSADGDPFQALPGMFSDIPETLIESNYIYMNQHGTSDIEIIGNVVFDWDPELVIGTRFKLAIRVYEGDPASIATESATWGDVKALFE